MSFKPKLSNRDVKKQTNSLNTKTGFGQGKKVGGIPMEFFENNEDQHERNWSNILSFDTDSLIMVNQKKDNGMHKDLMNQELVMLRREKPHDKDEIVIKKTNDKVAKFSPRN